MSISKVKQNIIMVYDTPLCRSPSERSQRSFTPSPSWSRDQSARNIDSSSSSIDNPRPRCPPPSNGSNYPPPPPGNGVALRDSQSQTPADESYGSDQDALNEMDDEL